ncbi:hypothetical protein [Anaplasma bovis]
MAHTCKTIYHEPRQATNKKGLGQVLETMKEDMELLKRKLEESFLRYGQE